MCWDHIIEAEGARALHIKADVRIHSVEVKSYIGNIPVAVSIRHSLQLKETVGITGFIEVVS